MSTSRGKRLILEEKVEDYLVEQVEKYGGITDKFCTPGRRGPPDRLVTWPRFSSDVVGPTHSKMELVEVKTLDEFRNPTSLDPPQVNDHKRRLAVGCVVRVIWTKWQVDEYIRYEMSRRGTPLPPDPIFEAHRIIADTNSVLKKAEYSYREVKPRKFRERASARIGVAGSEFAPYVEGQPCDPGFGGQ